MLQLYDFLLCSVIIIRPQTSYTKLTTFPLLERRPPFIEVAIRTLFWVSTGLYSWPCFPGWSPFRAQNIASLSLPINVPDELFNNVELRNLSNSTFLFFYFRASKSAAGEVRFVRLFLLLRAIEGAVGCTILTFLPLSLIGWCLRRKVFVIKRAVLTLLNNLNLLGNICFVFEFTT